MTAFALAKEVGVSQQTLSRWRTATHSVPRMNTPKQDEGAGAPKSPRQWTAAEKLQVVLDAASMDESELGAFLRERGLHMTQLASWRALIASALAERRPQKAGSREEPRRIRALEKELLRKNLALAEVTALLALQKKVQALWGDADDDTSKKSAK